MKTRLVMTALALGLAMTMVGCASGVKYDKFAMPALEEGKGRIVCYRSSSPVGAAVQPSVRLNNVKVGKSAPGGFFFVDMPPGNYEVSCSTESESSLKFTLPAGETRYVCTHIEMGMWVGHVIPTLEDEAKAKKTLRGCSYTGEAK